VKQVIGHLAASDSSAKLSACDPDIFVQHVKTTPERSKVFSELFVKVDGMNGSEILSWWRQERTALLDAMRELDPKHRLPWYGPPMSARSFVTARLMETWAHGQDIVDVFDIHRSPTSRLRHIAHLGYITFGWSFSVRNLEVPKIAVRVELLSPEGQWWNWGPEAAKETVRGSVEDFCLVVTQRRHVEDTGLIVTGNAAENWMRVAQCFAGPPDEGPKPGMFTKRRK
jgi:uncharacterized protein (TIGR03084 family)